MPATPSNRRSVLASLAILIVLFAARTAGGWRHFPSLMGDQGWYLRVALRVSQGDVLYRDVAWGYGPFPILALAFLFRTLGTDAGLASLVNGILASASVLLTYASLRSLLASRYAFLFTAFAALAGPYVTGDLFRLHFYVYSQAVAWASVASLAALAAALRWLITRHRRWLALAGISSGISILSKPEFGIVALVTLVAILIAGKGSAWDWLGGFSAFLAVALGGLMAVAQSAGWDVTWRGITDYDFLRSGQAWGTARVDWLASVYLFWLLVLTLWFGKRRPRWRYASLICAAMLGVTILVALGPTLVDGSARSALNDLRSGNWAAIRLAPANGLAWFAAVVWTPVWLLLGWAGWRALHFTAPATWWGLWAFAVTSNVRYVLTGFASGYALAPALAVLWWLLLMQKRRVVHVPGPWPQASLPSLALVGIGLVAAVNLTAQALIRDRFFNVPLDKVQTVLGPVSIERSQAREVNAIQSRMLQQIPAGAPIFSVGLRAAGWYLVTGHPNPTAFDIIVPGIGTTEPEASQVQADLAQNPPAVVLVPWPMQTFSDPTTDAFAIRKGLSFWWDALAHDYSTGTPPDVTGWDVFFRRQVR